MKEVPVAIAGEPFVVDDAGREELGITPRELEILGLIADGLSNREIADKLCVSENTVKTHSSRVFGKPGAKRRTQAVQIAKASRLIPGPQMKITLTSVLGDDQSKALKFYTDVLGFVKKTEIPVGQDKWLTVVSSEGAGRPRAAPRASGISTGENLPGAHCSTQASR